MNTDRIPTSIDIVDSTALTGRPGDTAFRQKARVLDEAMRSAIRDNGGSPVEGKTLGDGVLAVFTSAKQAIARALDYHNAASEGGVSLHAGEPIEEDGDLFGATVILASRMAGEAEGGEILVADTVRGLCSGKGFLFADRGEFVAKGIEEPVRVYEVSWRNA